MFAFCGKGFGQKDSVQRYFVRKDFVQKDFVQKDFAQRDLAQKDWGIAHRPLKNLLKLTQTKICLPKDEFLIILF